MRKGIEIGIYLCISFCFFYFLLSNIVLFISQSSSLGVSAAFLRNFMQIQSPTLVTWQLKESIVVPATSARKCPYVNILDSHFVGKATVFVSHAYSYLVADTFEVMLRYEESHPNSFFWFDPFSLNQHSDTGVVDTATLEHAFGDNILSIGSTLIVSSPWNDPCFLNRAWCLFELMTSINVKVPVEILVPHAQEQIFVKDLANNFEVVYEALARIDSRKAQAREAKDLEAINRAIERTATHAGLNIMANKAMRKWLLDTVLGEEIRLKQSGDDMKLRDFQYPSTIMLYELGDFIEGERMARECLLGCEERLGPDHSDTLASVNSLAMLLQAQGSEAG